MGSSSYVASSAWNDQNDRAMSHGLGIMQRSVSPQLLPEVQAGTWWLPRSSSGTLHQLPGRRATTLPAPVTASMAPTESPFFLLSPWAVPLFYCAEVTLSIYTILQRNHASGDRRAGLGGDRPERPSMHNRRDRTGEEAKGTEIRAGVKDGQPSQFSQS